MAEKTRNVKGQIEIVAVVAFVALALVAAFLVLQPPDSSDEYDIDGGMLSDEQKLVRDSILNLIKLGAEEELARLYEHGGFIDTNARVNVDVGGYDMPIWAACGEVDFPDIEKELAAGLKNYLLRYLGSRTEFYGKDVDIDISGIETEVKLQDRRVIVHAILPTKLNNHEMPPYYEVVIAANTKEIYEFSKGLVTEANNSKFFEIVTMLSMSQSKEDSEYWTPISDVLTKCGERVSRKRPEFLHATKEMIRYTVNHVVWDREPPRIADNMFYYLDTVNGKKYDLDVMFSYPESWDEKLEDVFATNPETLNAVAKPLVPLAPICLGSYGVSYSFQYPVLVAVNDDIFHKHFRFIAYYVSIRDNLPDTECSATLFDGRDDYEELCVNSAECDYNFKVVDTDGNALSGADVTFYKCDLGTTGQDGSLSSDDDNKMPCMMGELIVRRDGYMTHGSFINPEDARIQYIVEMERRVTEDEPMKVKYFGIPMLAYDYDDDGEFPYYGIFGPVDLITNMKVPLSDDNFKLEVSLTFDPLEPNIFTEEDAKFLIDNLGEDGEPVSVKEEGMMNPIEYNVTGIVTDTERSTVIGYFNQIVEIEEGQHELCVYMPVATGKPHSFPGLKPLSKSLRPTENEKIGNMLRSSGLEYFIGNCGPVDLTTCGDGQCEGGETCEKIDEDYVKCPDKSNLGSSFDCRPSCTYCGDTVVDDIFGEECDYMETPGPDSSFGFGVSKENQYSCSDECKQTGGWCGDGEVQEDEEECDSGSDESCCIGCKWTCSAEDGDEIVLEFTTGETTAVLSSGQHASVTFPACRSFDPSSTGGKATLKTIVDSERTAIVFVTDTSLSMGQTLDGNAITGDPCSSTGPWTADCRMKFAVVALKNAVDILKDSVANEGTSIDVGLVRFSSDVRFLDLGKVDDNVHSGKIEDEIDSYLANGMTYTDSAVLKATELLNNYAQANVINRKIMIILSDGDPSGGHEPSDETEAAKNHDKPIEIYTIALTDDPALKNDMCEWSSDNGENCYADEGKYAYTGTNLENLYADIINDILQKPEGVLKITTKAVDSPESSVSEISIEDDVVIDIDFSAVTCDEEGKQEVEIRVEFDGGGQVELSDMKINYCRPCDGEPISGCGSNSKSSSGHDYDYEARKNYCNNHNNNAGQNMRYGLNKGDAKGPCWRNKCCGDDKWENYAFAEIDDNLYEACCDNENDCPEPFGGCKEEGAELNIGYTYHCNSGSWVRSETE